MYCDNCGAYINTDYCTQCDESHSDESKGVGGIEVNTSSIKGKRADIGVLDDACDIKEGV